MNSILEYMDYRAYLRDWFAEAKARRKGVSLRWFGARAGISSPVFPKLVMDGTRNLGEAGIVGFADAMGLVDKERTFWIHLVGFNQAKNSTGKQEHYAVLSHLMHSVPEVSLGSAAFRYYSHWYLPVLRELVTLQDFQENWTRLARWVLPHITPQEAQSGVESLVEMGLLKKRADGKYSQTRKAVTSGTPWSRKALLEFHKTMLSHSSAAIESLPRESRHASSATLGVSRATYDAILVEYEAFRSRVLSLVHRDQNCDRVVHMGFQLIPVSQDPQLEASP